MTSITQHKRLFLPVVLLALLVVGVGLFIGSGSVFALLDPPADFEGDDGNFAVDTNGNNDWATFVATVAIGDETGAAKSTDTSFKNGTKEDTIVPITGTGSIPPNKDDLQRFYVQDAVVGGDTFLYLGWVRKDTPRGTANMDFELNQSDTLSANLVTPVRTAGDILIQYDWSSGGGIDEFELFLAEWTTSGPCEAANAPPCWGVRSTDLITAGKAEAGVHSGTSITDPIGSAFFGTTVTIGDRSFGEAAINLTEAGVLDACTEFGRAYLKSRASDSFTASLKDFIAPEDISVGESCSIGSRKFHDFNGDGTDVVDSGATLGPAISATTPTVEVTNTTDLVEEQVIKVDDEKMLIIAINGTDLTVDRGVNDTTAVTHGAGAPVLIVEDPGLGGWKIHLVGTTDANVVVHEHLTCRCDRR